MSIYKVLLLSISIILCVTEATPLTSKPKRSTKQQNISGGRLAIQVLRNANEFTKRNDPEKEIAKIENKTLSETQSSSQKGPQKLYDFVPSLYASRYYPNSSRKQKRAKRGRRRLKRGARINHDAAYISEFPTNRRIYRIVNKLGFCLRIHMDGRVDGTQDNKDERSLLAFESHGPSILRIKGVVSNRYLVITQKGLPSAEVHPKLFNSLFRLTHEENSWDTFASFKYYFDEKYDMLIGITKDAIVKKPWKAAPGQYATQFLPIPP